MTGLPAPLPAHDLDAERAVLSALLLGDVSAGACPPPSAYFDPKHRRIAAACAALAAAGTPLDPVTVAGWLRERDQLLAVGGAPYLANVVDDVPAVGNVAAHAAIVLRHARTRAEVATLEGALARLKTGAAGETWREDLAARLGELGGEGKRPLALDASAIFAPLERIPWLCRALAIGPGRPTLLSGYGGIGKTFAAQALALTVAAGRSRLWDCFDVQHTGGVVGHLDYEQGEWITRWRYQRLAYSMGLSGAALEGRLELACCPGWSLTSADAEARLTAFCRGKALVLIDSLRAACPGVDENDSAIGSYLYLCFRVSEATGCVIVVIHHEGKTNAENPRTGIERLRGSSAIAAAAGAVVSFVKDSRGDGSGGGVIRIEHTRANLGAPAEPELIRFVDEGETDPVTEKSVGLRIEWLPREQVRAEASAASDEALEADFRALCDRLLAAVRRAPDGVTGAGALIHSLRLREQDARRAWAHLRETGAVVGNGRTGKAARWHASEVPKETGVEPEGSDSVNEAAQ